MKWPTVKLGDICEIIRGLTYKKTDEVAEGGTIVLRANNIDLNTNRLTFDELKRVSIPVSNSKLLKSRDVLICLASGSKPHLGKVAYVSQNYDFTFGGFMGVVRSTSRLYSRFLFFTLTASPFREYLSTRTEGTNINNLRVEDLQTFAIPLPPVEEQKRIVARLEKALEQADALSAAFSDLAQTAQTAYQSLLHHTFASLNAPSHPLGDLCEIRAGQSPNGKSINVEHGLEFHQGKIYFSQKELLPSPQKTSEVTKTAPSNTLLLCVRAPVGKVNITKRKICIGRGLAVVIPGPTVALEYLFYSLSTREKQFLSLSNPGSTFPSISVKAVASLSIPLPPMEEQKRIVASLEKTEAQLKEAEALARQGAALCATLRQSLLEEAFRNE